MKGITVRPPWSWAIAEAASLAALGVAPKLAENRGRGVARHHIGKDWAIHAGQSWDAQGAEDPRVCAAWQAFAAAIRPVDPNSALAAIGDTRTGIVGPIGPGLWLDTGAVVAVATLAECHQAPEFGPLCCAPWGERWHETGWGARPAWHLVWANVRRLPAPVPVRGQQAVPWTLPPEVAERVTAQLTNGKSAEGPVEL